MRAKGGRLISVFRACRSSSMSSHHRSDHTGAYELRSAALPTTTNKQPRFQTEAMTTPPGCKGCGTGRVSRRAGAPAMVRYRGVVGVPTHARPQRPSARDARENQTSDGWELLQRPARPATWHQAHIGHIMERDRVVSQCIRGVGSDRALLCSSATAALNSRTSTPGLTLV